MDMFDMSFPLPKDPNQDILEMDKLKTISSDSCPSPTQAHPDQFSDATQHSRGSKIDTQRERAALIKGLSPIQMPALVIGAQSDILFPIWQQKEISDCLKLAGNKSVAYYELDALYGHDTFLIDRVNVGSAVKGHLEMSGAPS